VHQGNTAEAKKYLENIKNSSISALKTMPMLS
jgi:hypothetical protein